MLRLDLCLLQYYMNTSSESADDKEQMRRVAEVLTACLYDNIKTHSVPQSMNLIGSIFY